MTRTVRAMTDVQTKVLSQFDLDDEHAGSSLFATIVGKNGAIDVINGISLLILAIGIAFSAPRVYPSPAGTFYPYHCTLIGMNEIRGFSQCVVSDHETIG